MVPKIKLRLDGLPVIFVNRLFPHQLLECGIYRYMETKEKAGFSLEDTNDCRMMARFLQCHHDHTELGRYFWRQWLDCGSMGSNYCSLISLVTYYWGAKSAIPTPVYESDVSARSDLAAGNRIS
ncbi:hypothetical protein [Siminovitchia sp. FSL W7-1587]|uniref:hypothetical protein n=1 Tax=Siminovitchia sp. FSL W7-1587 TaxID=2954699 RepID=UPI0030D56003